MPNRLAAERSPYLLQHADNPVDWYPWGQEAFDEARRADKPIFLSIGYSTCHWCHVMAHESFESRAIADMLNTDFVSIKVDREERPDVDRVYMTFVQATTGSGGWPMSVWLTPELKPFYGGTYFAPDARWGRPGFPEILREIVRVWRQERMKVEESAANLTEQIKGLRAVNPGGEVPAPESLKEGVAQFAQTFDQVRGGFGDAPKFPRPSELLFLLRETARTGDYTPAFMVAKTLQAMSLGGMRDHVGGGFHRYSVDGNWRVPHFEKMLYDQASDRRAAAPATSPPPPSAPRRSHSPAGPPDSAPAPSAKKLISCVRPGVFDARASALRPVSALISARLADVRPPGEANLRPGPPAAARPSPPRPSRSRKARRTASAPAPTPRHPAPAPP